MYNSSGSSRARNYSLQANYLPRVDSTTFASKKTTTFNAFGRLDKTRARVVLIQVNRYADNVTLRYHVVGSKTFW